MKKGLALENFPRNFTGFSLIEIIIAVAIILLFSGLAIPRYNSFNQELKLKGESKRLAAVLELAKKKAVASELFSVGCSDFRAYRIVISSDSFSLNFNCGGVYETVQNYEFENGITAVAGVGNFDFPAGGFGINILTGTIRLKNAGISQCVDISITPLGIISVSESLISC